MKPEYYQKIWNKVLADGEKTKYEFVISNKYLKFNIILWIILSFFLMFIPLPFALFYYGYYLKVANAYAFTNKRILVHRGWLSTTTISIDYDKITDIRVSESFLEKILYKTGSLVINTAGTGRPEVMLYHIDSPYEVKKNLEKIKG